MTAHAPAGQHTGRTLAVYTVGRFVVFFVLTGVLFGIGLGLIALTGHSIGHREMEPVALTAAFIAAPLSMLVSYFVLARQRMVLTNAVERTVTRYKSRVEAKTAAEDAYADWIRDHPTGDGE